MESSRRVDRENTGQRGERARGCESVSECMPESVRERQRERERERKRKEQPRATNVEFLP